MRSRIPGFFQADNTVGDEKTIGRGKVAQCVRLVWIFNTLEETKAEITFSNIPVL